jgi:cytochrome c oxidase cbb3-type subunit 3
MDVGGKLMAPDLTKYGTPTFVVDILHSGKYGAIGGMPSFANKGTINDVQMKAVATYVTTELSGIKK